MTNLMIDPFVILVPFTDLVILIDPDVGIVATAGFAVAMAALAIKIGRRDDEDGDP